MQTPQFKYIKQDSPVQKARGSPGLHVLQVVATAQVSASVLFLEVIESLVEVRKLLQVLSMEVGLEFLRCGLHANE